MSNGREGTIYCIIGDDGYGMVIKKKKADRMARNIVRAFVVPFDDVLTGYMWLSSQINDYSESYFNSTRVLTRDDLVPLDELICRQYVILPDEEARRRGMVCYRGYSVWDEPLRIRLG